MIFTCLVSCGLNWNLPSKHPLRTSRLRTIVSPFEIGVGDGARVHGGLSKDGDHSREVGSVVEAPLELRERSYDVLAADGTIGAHDRALDVAQDRVHPLEGRMAGSAAA